MMLGDKEKLRMKTYDKKECQVSLLAVNVQFGEYLHESWPKCRPSPGVKWHQCGCAAESCRGSISAEEWRFIHTDVWTLSCFHQVAQVKRKVLNATRFWWRSLLVFWKLSGRFGKLRMRKCDWAKIWRFWLKDSGCQSTDVTYFRSQETLWSLLSVAWGMLGTGRVWTTPSMGWSCTMSLLCGKPTSTSASWDHETSWDNITTEQKRGEL